MSFGGNRMWKIKEGEKKEVQVEEGSHPAQAAEVEMEHCRQLYATLTPYARITATSARTLAACWR